MAGRLAWVKCRRTNYLLLQYRQYLLNRRAKSLESRRSFIGRAAFNDQLVLESLPQLRKRGAYGGLADPKRLRYPCLIWIANQSLKEKDQV